MAEKFTIYSSAESQWVGVMLLALEEKGLKANVDYDVKEISLSTGENFAPEYIAINPNGTVPSLTAPSLAKPLTESADILRWIDSRGTKTLVPQDEARSKEILDLMHSPSMSTNLILFQARDPVEMESKKKSGWNAFLEGRQTRLDKELAAHPEHSFYISKAAENLAITSLYRAEVGSEHKDLYKLTDEMYRTMASGLDKLESLIALPFAAGSRVSEADYNTIPWLSHAMMGANTPVTAVQDFGPLEKLIQKTVPDFKIGPKTKEWWSNVAKTEAFKKVFPVLH
ncbi:uncharacterized protein TRIVIDRAFT_62580 [Trichoderma virens Gv29-8]|uniref:GST N-terminal domain-containing protein n=1 Tax=Hypocrea virens (strain Gv29-8 / FGSC 10586) TaxID=413071 RepID=G9MFM0_HYPVG|nr:uncharacterized protein TRIVIDRAFT_62580 [Trichoderma virens Gv29-8]EHK26769.1 hypothetical protein TRIVIDRAFT_62580 [Trichoderma virens Gv29-8]UKZ57222.1 hypothetical protein TrVGV298_011074 [Trichoderma virens]UKZ82953.1 hypothetical protein TrVFT333_010753 [Trichoderma virens FT-333]